MALASLIKVEQMSARNKIIFKNDKDASGRTIANLTKPQSRHWSSLNNFLGILFPYVWIYLSFASISGLSPKQLFRLTETTTLYFRIGYAVKSRNPLSQGIEPGKQRYYITGEKEERNTPRRHCLLWPMRSRIVRWKIIIKFELVTVLHALCIYLTW